MLLFFEVLDLSLSVCIHTYDCHSCIITHTHRSDPTHTHTPTNSAQLDSAVQGTPPPEPPATSSSRSSSKSSKGGGSSKRSKPSSSSEPAAPLTAEEEEEGIKRRVYLYLSLCAKNEALVGGVFEAYAAAAAAGAASEGGEGGNRAAVVMRVLEGEMDAFVKHVVTVRFGAFVVCRL